MYASVWSIRSHRLQLQTPGPRRKRVLQFSPVLKCYQLRGLSPPDPHRGLCPLDLLWRLCPQTRVIGSCFALAMVPTNHWPLPPPMTPWKNPVGAPGCGHWYHAQKLAKIGYVVLEVCCGQKDTHARTHARTHTHTHAVITIFCLPYWGQSNKFTV